MKKIIWVFIFTFIISNPVYSHGGDEAQDFEPKNTGLRERDRLKMVLLNNLIIKIYIYKL